MISSSLGPLKRSSLPFFPPPTLLVAALPQQSRPARQVHTQKDSHFVAGRTSTLVTFMKQPLESHKGSKWGNSRSKPKAGTLVTGLCHSNDIKKSIVS